MKRILILSLALLSLTACSNLSDYDNMDATTKAEASAFVDEVMQAFRNGTIGIRCPDVKWVHIPALLEYGNSTEIIGDDPSAGPARAIPSNPISSYLMFQCSEGMFALWMAEAARIHTLDPMQTGINKGMMGWPSQNPMVQRAYMDGADYGSPLIINDAKVQQEVLAAYTNWWKAGKGKREAAATDPLEGTGYRWH